MISLRRKIKLRKIERLFATSQQIAILNENVHYPKIVDDSYKARKENKAIEWHEEIKKLNTVEEKLIKINMPRYYGYKTVMFTDKIVHYNSMHLTNHYTRTIFNEVEKIPFKNQNENLIESYVKCIKNSVEEAVSYAKMFFESKHKKWKDLTPFEKEELLTAEIVSHINRQLLNGLMADFPHLSEIELDLSPRHEAFWFVGGVYPPKSIRKARENLSWMKDFANDPIDRAVQYIGTPYLALRHKNPLPNFTSEFLMPEGKEIPVFPYDARTIGYNCSHRHGSNVPGFWPGSAQEFGLLSYQRRHIPLKGKHCTEDHKTEAIHVQGIQSSYAWLLSQACYQGFSTFNDLIYPLSTQTIITNGKHWSFYAYQLNTTLVHYNNVHKNPKVNFCWGTKEYKLYDEVDENGKCIGFNDEVLKHLLRFYLNSPVKQDINLKPYLGENEKKIADIEDDKKREFLERTYKHMVSNRPRHFEIPEMYMWERLYKVNNKTRPMEARRRFFELGINPYKRRMDEHWPVYIPKALRPGGPKSKPRHEKTYYP